MKLLKKHIAGFNLTEILIILLLVSVAIAATIPILTKKKPPGVSHNALDCIYSDVSDIIFDATGQITTLPSNGTSCNAAYMECKTDNNCETLKSYADGAGTSNQTIAALKILRAACDENGEQACDYFISRCFDNSTNCTDPDSKYTLRYYTNLSSSVSNPGKTLIEEKGTEYYGWGMTTFVNEVNAVCSTCPGTTTACNIKCD